MNDLYDEYNKKRRIVNDKHWHIKESSIDAKHIPEKAKSLGYFMCKALKNDSFKFTGRRKVDKLMSKIK